MRESFSKTYNKLLEVAGEITLTSFLAGIAVSITLLTILNFVGQIEVGPITVETSTDDLPPREVGQKTVGTINEKVLSPSPNNVEAELVNVTSADDIGLENFYRVNLNVTNPAGSQLTSVYSKKNGELVFMQFPRSLEGDFDDDKYR